MNVVWTKQAEDSFTSVIDYLLEEWTTKEATNFIDLVEFIIEQIKINLEQFKVSVFDKKSREEVITKQTTMFYRLKTKTTIEIEYFWNNYRNPKNIKSSVKNT